MQLLLLCDWRLLYNGCEVLTLITVSLYRMWIIKSNFTYSIRISCQEPLDAPSKGRYAFIEQAPWTPKSVKLSQFFLQPRSPNTSFPEKKRTKFNWRSPHDEFLISNQVVGHNWEGNIYWESVDLCRWRWSLLSGRVCRYPSRFNVADVISIQHLIVRRGLYTRLKQRHIFNWDCLIS